MERRLHRPWAAASASWAMRPHAQRSGGAEGARGRSACCLGRARHAYAPPCPESIQRMSDQRGGKERCIACGVRGRRQVRSGAQGGVVVRSGSAPAQNRTAKVFCCPVLPIWLATCLRHGVWGSNDAAEAEGCGEMRSVGEPIGPGWGERRRRAAQPFEEGIERVHYGGVGHIAACATSGGHRVGWEGWLRSGTVDE